MTIKQLLMNRDEMSEGEAQELIDETQEDINDLLENDGSLGEAEQVIADNLGLEPDFLMEFLPA